MFGRARKNAYADARRELRETERALRLARRTNKRELQELRRRILVTGDPTVRSALLAELRAKLTGNGATAAPAAPAAPTAVVTSPTPGAVVGFAQELAARDAWTSTQDGRNTGW